MRTELKDWEYTIVNGVLSDSPMKGIGQAHVNCIMLAKQNEWDQVLIMEDDVQLRQGANEFITKAFQNLPPDWDILLGGLYHGKVAPYNEYWNKTGEFCGLHFYIVNKRVYDEILKYDGQNHIDRWMNKGGGKLKCYVTSRFIATQRNGFSDNVCKVVDYSDKLSRYKLL